MRIYDLSQPITAGMAVWPGDPQVHVESITSPDSVTVSRLVLGSHTGTHVDAPAHLTPGGRTVDALPLSALIGDAWVVEVPSVGLVEVADLLAVGWLPECRRLLLRAPRGAVLSSTAASTLVEDGLQLLGVEAASVDAVDSLELPVHKTLLGANVVIVEGLRLVHVPPGRYRLCCLPLAIGGGDGAPARAVLCDMAAISPDE